MAANEKLIWARRQAASPNLRVFPKVDDANDDALDADRQLV
jgi:hypothetical protein